MDSRPVFVPGSLINSQGFFQAEDAFAPEVNIVGNAGENRETLSGRRVDGVGELELLQACLGIIQELLVVVVTFRHA